MEQKKIQGFSVTIRAWSGRWETISLESFYSDEPPAVISKKARVVMQKMIKKTEVKPETNHANNSETTKTKT